MRVALLAPIIEDKSDYNPWVNLTSLLVEGLQNHGVEVTLVSSHKLPSCNLLTNDSKDHVVNNFRVSECLQVSALFERADEFDVIHNLHDFFPLIYSRLVHRPVITTLWGDMTPDSLAVYKKYNENDNIYYVAVNETARHPQLHYAATIHQGVGLNQYPFRDVPGKYWLFYGAVSPDNQVRELIEIARQSGMAIKISGQIQDEEYFHKEIQPRLDEKTVTYSAVPGWEKLSGLIQEAYALIFPPNFIESFGLLAIQAMAGGTPVIAFSQGAMPEFVQYGKTGFLISGWDEAASILPQVKDINRRQCRIIAEEFFSGERMVKEYLQLYRKVAAKHKREDYRPWGHYEVLADEPGYKVKRITVLPGKRLSLQYHHRRTEHWVIASGEALVTLDDLQVYLKTGEAIDIPREAKHRIENPGECPLLFIELQRGDYLGEDDIIRIDDDFGRLTLMVDK
ncbi:MAG: glycosyltransferase [Candidatus Schekmanbacteria bacterium]|nr:glycosyltransferase [Candidatus Schekmanbacteria bacterium]